MRVPSLLVLSSLLLLSLSTSSFVHARNPGVTTTLTQKGLSYAASVGLKYLESQLSSLKIPNQNGDDHSISWTVSSIKLSGVKIPSGNIKIDSNKGLTVSVNGVSATLNANWHGREDGWPHPSASGSANVAISNTDLSAELLFSENHGKPTVKAGKVSVQINGFDMHFSGDLSFILNLLEKIFKGKIQSAATNAMVGAIENAINDNLKQVLQSIPSDIPIKINGKEVAYVNDTLTSPEYFASSYFNIPFNGEFYNSEHPTESPFKASKMPLSNSDTSSHMFQVFLNQFIPNSASYVFSQIGLLNYTVTADMIPKSSPVQFNTSDWGGFVPGLPQKYPGWAMQGYVANMGYPTVSFNASGADAFGKAYFYMYVINPKTKALSEAFTLGFNVSADGLVNLQGGNITGKLNYFASGVWLISSNVGAFDVAPLESLVKFLSEALVLPYINTFLAGGVPVPAVKGLTFSDTHIVYDDQYVCLSSNIKYTIPSEMQGSLPPVSLIQ